MSVPALVRRAAHRHAEQLERAGQQPWRNRGHRVQFTELQVTLDKAHPWEVDGEIMGSTRRLTIVAQPGALLLRVPPESA
jgi:diacylglycerol kinase family enzyme